MLREAVGPGPYISLKDYAGPTPMIGDKAPAMYRSKTAQPPLD